MTSLLSANFMPTCDRPLNQRLRCLITLMDDSLRHSMTRLRHGMTRPLHSTSTGTLA